MKRNLRTLLLLLAFGFFFGAGGRADTPATPAPDEITVVAEGMAPLGDDPTAAEDEAIWDAKRNAVEQAAGVILHAHTLGQNASIFSDEIHGSTNGFVKTWEVVAGSRHVEQIGNGEVLRLQVRATVALLPMIHKLADIADVYNDLERPRLRIEIVGDDDTHRVQNALIAAFKAQGFEIAEGDTAEIVLHGNIEITPTIRLGDRDTPYGVGDAIAASRARISVRVTSTASEAVLLEAEATGGGRSFHSDAEAGAAAAERAAKNLIAQSQRQFVENLLARWARERQEGHVIAVQLPALTARQSSLLRQNIGEMRGFRELLADSDSPGQTVLRFLTRLDTPSVRRRLADIVLDGDPIKVLNARGPTILCAVRAHPRPHKTSSKQSKTLANKTKS